MAKFVQNEMRVGVDQPENKLDYKDDLKARIEAERRQHLHSDSDYDDEEDMDRDVMDIAKSHQKNRERYARGLHNL